MLHPESTEIYFTFNNGNKVPALGFGTSAPHQRLSETKQAVKSAIKAGYRHIDTAWVYGTEEYVGEALQELFEEGFIKREDIHITTKVWHHMWNDVEESLCQSLKALKLDYVDMLLQHWPLCTVKQYDANGVGKLAHTAVDGNGKVLFDEKGDWIRTYKKMESIYLDPDDSRVRAIGVSNFPIEYLTRVLDECKVIPACNQVECHPHLPQLELRDFCKDHHILLAAYSPLGGTGAPNLDIPLVASLAQKYNASLNDILTSYHIRQGSMVIARSLNPVRIASNLEFVPLSPEDLDSLHRIGLMNRKRYTSGASTAGIPSFSENVEHLENREKSLF